MARKDSRRASLPEACIAEALAIIERSGVESLSLREVARRLGVSHQAPYKHYPSREHLLAEVVARAFAAFAAHLDARPRHADPFDDLREMGRAYLGYARAHPLQYRLMFGTPLPDAHAHPEMLRNSRHAYALLHEAIGRLEREGNSSADLDALYVWATMHGLASIMESSVLETVPLPASLLDKAVPHAMARLRTALSTGSGESAAGARGNAGTRRRKSQAAAARRSPTTR
jgi:AcrR family transcriptional regulator